VVVAEETIEAVILLEEVFTGCSDRTAFLALEVKRLNFKFYFLT